MLILLNILLTELVNIVMYYEQQQVFDQNDIYAYPVTDISYIRGDASLSSSSPPPSR